MLFDSQEIVINVAGLGKCYQIYERPVDRLKQFIIPYVHSLFRIRNPTQYFSEFWALKDVSFQVKKGETIGIVGRNGAGKSTLLQIVCGTLTPTVGEIQLKGRVAALLELGSGFNPEFTGRENIFFYAGVLGLTQEQVEQRLGDILAFADIGEFVEQPVKTYSSGMMVRLAFAVVAHVDADILIIDEALAVGDVFFQQKCMRFLRNYQQHGGSILFVTHDTSAVLNLCNKALLLYADRNELPLFNSADVVCNAYLESLYADPRRFLQSESQSVANDGNNRNLETLHLHIPMEELPSTIYSVSEFNANAESFGKRGGRILNVEFYDENRNKLVKIYGDQKVILRFTVHAHANIKWPAFGFMLKNSLGEYLYTEGTDHYFRAFNLELCVGQTVIVEFLFTMPHLIRGKYLLNVAFAEGVGDDHIQHDWIHDAVQLDVISSRLVHGYSSMNNMSISMIINGVASYVD